MSSADTPAAAPLFATDRLRVHALTASDAPRLQAVYEGAADYFKVLTEMSAPEPDTALHELRQCAAQPGRQAALITLVDGTEIGALGWWAGRPTADVALLGMVLVLPAQRAHGYAREALAGLQAWLLEQGVHHLRTAIPYRRAVAAQGVVRALGFREMSIAEHTRMGMAGAGISLWEKPIG